MTHLRPDEIDRRVRETFGVEPAAIRRVTDGALAAAEGPPRRTWVLRAIVATVSVLALAAAVAWWPRPPVPAETTEQVVTASFVDGVLVLSFPDGSASISGADRRDERPPDGFGIVLVNGDTR